MLRTKTVWASSLWWYLNKLIYWLLPFCLLIFTWQSLSTHCKPVQAVIAQVWTKTRSKINSQASSHNLPVADTWSALEVLCGSSSLWQRHMKCFVRTLRKLYNFCSNLVPEPTDLWLFFTCWGTNELHIRLNGVQAPLLKDFRYKAAWKNPETKAMTRRQRPWAWTQPLEAAKPALNVASPAQWHLLSRTI